jgi:concanavalin A-like lectin/glucanase superfamily protein
VSHRRLVASLAAATALLTAAPGAALAAPAQVSLRPAAGPAGTPVVLQGTGFPASRSVLVGARGGAVHALRASRAGSFTARLTIPAGRAGTVEIVSSRGRASVVNRFLAASRAPAAGIEVASRRGRVRASPAALLPGGLLVLRGSGLRHRALLTITFVGTRRRVTTSRRGDFTAAIGVPAAQRAGAWPALVAGAGARLAFRVDVLASAVAARPPVGGSESPAGSTTGTAPGGGGVASPPPGPARPANTAAPAITGTAAIGRRLTATSGTWTGAAPITFTFAWRRCDGAGAGCVAIAGATARTHTVATADAGHTLRVDVTARGGAGSTVASSAPTAVVPAPPPATGIVAQWHMDETSGTVMHDAVGGHDGTLSGVTPGVPGFSGTAFAFTRGTVTVPSAAALNPGSATLRITIHLNTTARPATPDWDLIRKGLFTDAGGEYKVEYQPSGQASCGFVGSAGSNELIAGPALDDGAWHTVTCVRNASGIQVIVDGTTFSKAGAVGAISNTADLLIGTRGGSEFFQGSLDEASVRVG